MFAPDRIDTLIYWIKERERIRVRKEAGLPKPWTQDALMAGTRWCNVRRMDDKVSRWLLEHFYGQQPKRAVTAATVARLINWPDTLASLYRNGWPGRWDKEYFEQNLLARKQLGRKVFTGVYIINAAAATDDDRESGGAKIKVVARTIQAIDECGSMLMDTTSMEETHRRLQSVQGIGSFIAGQIVADLRWVARGEWYDRDSWAPSGPGSRRGMLYLMGHNDRVSLSDAQFIEGLRALIPILQRRVRKVWDDRQLEAHDVQNCLCEISKYARLQAGGRSKNKYPGGL